MYLTIENSAPNPAPMGDRTAQVYTPVVLGGQVSDFDGDPIDYEWLDGDVSLASGQVAAQAGGEAVDLPASAISTLSLGVHRLALRVSDRVNGPVQAFVTVTIVDTTVPTLAPVSDKTILWPPNHQLVTVTIMANAIDNSGMPVALGASIASTEPENGLGDGDTSPDWTAPVIDQTTGTITLQLRAERSGKGTGRQYTVTITATDASGNSSTANVKILVPHDKPRN
jgi:hypothetical protein